MPRSPYEAGFDAAAVDELKARIDLTRWPRGFAADHWDFGVDQGCLRELVDYWRHDFDFAAAAQRVIAQPNYRSDIDGLPLHHLHARAAREDATPMLLLHGWPGSVIEFLEVIPQLASLVAAGKQAFHVVAPSLQGFGGSPGIGRPGMTPVRIAHRLTALMSELGYERFIVHGGDWGTLLATHLASPYPQRMLGLHVTLPHPIAPAN